MVTIGRAKYKDYNGNGEGRRKFQIDLALAVMECGIKYDWPAPFDEKRKPEWLRQKSYVPCACGVCFFCKSRKTPCMQSRPAAATWNVVSIMKCLPS